MKSRVFYFLVLCSLYTAGIGKRLTKHGKDFTRKNTVIKKSNGVSKNKNNITSTLSAKPRDRIMSGNLVGQIGFRGNGFTGFTGQQELNIEQGENFHGTNDQLGGEFPNTGNGNGFYSDMSVGGYHGDEGRHYDHHENAHPHLELTQNVYKENTRHVFDGGPKHVYGGLTKHVPPPQHGPIHVVQGKQIEITTKPQHIDVHFYEYDKHGKRCESDKKFVGK